MHIYQLHNLMKQPTTTVTKRLHHNWKFPSLLAKRKMRLKYKIHNLLIQQMRWQPKSKQQLFSIRPAGAESTLQLHGEINFHPGKAGKVSTALLKNASWWLLLMITLFWKFSWMATSQRHLQRYIYLKSSKLDIFYISYCDVMLKRNVFLWILVR